MDEVFPKGVRMKHRVTMLSSPSSTHSLRLVQLAIASVWVSFTLLASVQEMRDLFHRRLPAKPEAK